MWTGSTYGRAVWLGLASALDEATLSLLTRKVKVDKMTVDSVPGNAMVAADSVPGGRVAADSVPGEEVAAGSVPGRQVAAGSVPGNAKVVAADSVPGNAKVVAADSVPGDAEAMGALAPPGLDIARNLMGKTPIVRGPRRSARPGMSIARSRIGMTFMVTKPGRSVLGMTAVLLVRRVTAVLLEPGVTAVLLVRRVAAVLLVLGVTAVLLEPGVAAVLLERLRPMTAAAKSTRLMILQGQISWTLGWKKERNYCGGGNLGPFSKHKLTPDWHLGVASE